MFFNHCTYVFLQFECEFRRFSVDRSLMNEFHEFYLLVRESHNLTSEVTFTVSYTDPRHGDLLPITNNDNMLKAFSTAMPLLRVFLYREQGKRCILCIRYHDNNYACICACRSHWSQTFKKLHCSLESCAICQ